MYLLHIQAKVHVSNNIICLPHIHIFDLGLVGPADLEINLCFIDVLLITGRYFDEISQDTGKYCFGVEDTLKALEMGAVEILIVYENLDIMRYVLHCQGTEGMRTRKWASVW